MLNSEVHQTHVCIIGHFKRNKTNTQSENAGQQTCIPVVQTKSSNPKTNIKWKTNETFNHAIFVIVEFLWTRCNNNVHCPLCLSRTSRSIHILCDREFFLAQSILSKTKHTQTHINLMTICHQMKIIPVFMAHFNIDNDHTANFGRLSLFQPTFQPSNSTNHFQNMPTVVRQT